MGQIYSIKPTSHKETINIKIVSLLPKTFYRKTSKEGKPEGWSLLNFILPVLLKFLFVTIRSFIKEYKTGSYSTKKKATFFRKKKQV